MNNFEKFKQDLTVERLVNILVDTHCGGACDYCVYKKHRCCIDYCKCGIKKWLESEAE